MPDQNEAGDGFSTSGGTPRSTFTLKDTGWVEAATRGRERGKVKSRRRETDTWGTRHQFSLFCSECIVSNAFRVPSMKRTTGRPLNSGCGAASVQICCGLSTAIWSHPAL